MKTNFNISSDKIEIKKTHNAPIAQWIRMHLPSCWPGFDVSFLKLSIQVVQQKVLLVAQQSGNVADSQS